MRDLCHSLAASRFGRNSKATPQVCREELLFSGTPPRDFAYVRSTSPVLEAQHRLVFQFSKFKAFEDANDLPPHVTAHNICAASASFVPCVHRATLTVWPQPRWPLVTATFTLPLQHPRPSVLRRPLGIMIGNITIRHYFNFYRLHMLALYARPLTCL